MLPPIKIFSGVLLLNLLLVACTGQVNALPVPAAETPAATILPSPFSPTATTDDLPTSTLPSVATTVESEPASSASPVAHTFQKTHYNLSAEFNYDQHHLVVEEKISYTNNSPESLPDLLLVVEPMLYPDVFQLTSLAWGDGQPVQGSTWDGFQLHIPLLQPLAPGEQISLALNYQLSLPSPVPSATTRPVPFGYTARQANLVDWYPYIAPYVPGKGWLAHPAGYYGEHLVYETSDYEVRIRLRDARPDLKIAASAPDQPQGEWHNYQLISGRNFAWSVSPEYQVITQTVGDVTVMSYAFPIHSKGGQSVLETTAKALDLYQKLFGPYPHKSISVVEADFLDGMEYDGLYFLSNGFYNLYQGTPGEYLVAIAAHETAHQWWYAMVGNDQALEPWLDEALATYSERLFYENTYPEALPWWWAYRVQYYQPRGWVDDSIYNPHGESEAYRAYRNAVYLNGAMFLEALRKQVSDEVFFAFLKDYLSQFTGKIATGNDFFNLLKRHTSADITPLIKQFFSAADNFK